jgi:hypothetical protein
MQINSQYCLAKKMAPIGREDLAVIKKYRFTPSRGRQLGQ